MNLVILIPMVENAATPVILVTHDSPQINAVVIISLYFVDKNGNRVIPPVTEACINKAMHDYKKEGLVYIDINASNDIGAPIHNALLRSNAYSNSALFIAVQSEKCAQKVFCYLEKHYSVSTG